MDLDRSLGPIPAVFLRLGVIFGSLSIIGLFFAQIGVDTKHFVFLFFTAIVLSSAILPAVRMLKTWHVPKSLAIFLVYIAIVAVVSGVVVLLIPLVSAEVQTLVAKAPTFAAKLTALAERLNQAAAGYGFQIDLKPEAGFFKEHLAPHIEKGFSMVGQTIQHSVGLVFHGLAGLLLVLLFGYFLAEDETFLQQASASTADDAAGATNATALVNRVVEKIGQGVRAQLLVALAFGCLYGTALKLIGVPFALTIGAAAVVLELIPFVGGITAIFLAVLVTLTQFDAPLVPLLLVVASFFAITVTTHKMLSPKLMESFLGIHKLIILVFLVVGAETWGIMGALLAVPAAIVASVLWTEAKAARMRRKAAEAAETPVVAAVATALPAELPAPTPPTDALTAPGPEAGPLK